VPAHQALLRGKRPDVVWLRSFVPQLATCSDRVMELAVQAREASPTKAAAVTRALASAAFASYTAELLLKLASQSESGKVYAEVFLFQEHMKVCHDALVKCGRHLEQAVDDRTREQVGEALRNLEQVAKEEVARQLKGDAQT